MNNYNYPALDENDDNGTMPENVATLANAIVGHRIVSVERDVTVKDRGSYRCEIGTALVLDNGKRVVLVDTDDCCAYTSLRGVIDKLPETDHIITAVRPDDSYTKWHILADLGEVLELQVGWSSGNPFYYGYGFDIVVEDA